MGMLMCKACGNTKRDDLVFFNDYEYWGMITPDLISTFQHCKKNNTLEWTFCPSCKKIKRGR